MLMESGQPPEDHDELIDLVTNPDSGYLHLFSQHQLQVRHMHTLSHGNQLTEISLLYDLSVL